ncbi:DUF721 domain-containing protein [Legionella birminghamensis]|nr:DUF721 domain-containing protein [Legionella birminghamensis]
MNKQLAEICLKSAEIDKLNTEVKKYLPEHLSPHCQVGSFSRGTLTLHIHNPAWATELRYCLPDLRDSLRRESGLYQLASVKIAVASENYEQHSPPKKTRQFLSAATCSSLYALSEVCSYEPLRDALRNLANNNKFAGDKSVNE